MANMEVIHNFLQEAYSEGIIDARETVELFEITEKFNNKKDEEKSDHKEDKKEDISKNKKVIIAISISVATAAVILIKKYITIKKEEKEIKQFERIFKENEKKLKEVLKKQSKYTRLWHESSYYSNNELQSLEDDIYNMCNDIVNDCLKFVSKKDAIKFCETMSQKYHKRWVQNINYYRRKTGSASSIITNDSMDKYELFGKIKEIIEYK